MANRKATSPTVAKVAAKALKESKSKTTRGLAGSALSQANRKNKTSQRMETLAGKILNDQRSTRIARQLAASVLAQGEKG